MTRFLDLNCDLGESYGVYSYGADAEMMPLITSANIACGAHAGDPATMRRSVRAALDHDVAMGAHVGLPDRWGFGRREIPTSAGELYDLCLAQLGALDAFVRAAGARLRHLKLHGSLYVMANRDPDLAASTCQAVLDFDSSLAVYALPGSALAKATGAAGLRLVGEYFADRPYAGTEVQMYRRSTEDPGTPEQAAARTLAALTGPEFSALGGIGTVCVHSDTVDAPRYLRVLRQHLATAGFSPRAPEQTPAEHDTGLRAPALPAS
ncbi:MULTISPECIES: LamB/YcsF family protein [unclassified Amycolatopsis]|uniref:LamB/YcsF family protein n=1 Tax=unclassified Amycolatopsis TaxID=2618356 RepID=UPI001C6A8C00|nr:5-oxoprolinase subunit PxpA [Amycolatopsis sp. DSM 110486]QYN19041.1 LamB/YcsF family protein [Amycolatopsis sp. DSM 110486]